MVRFFRSLHKSYVKMEVFKTILRFSVIVLIVLLLTAPYSLVICFPAVAQYITEISKTAIPWVIILLLLLIFNQGVKTLIDNLAGMISRIRRISAVGTVADLEDQRGHVSLTPEQVNYLRAQVDLLNKQSKDNVNLALTYFLKFIGSTIYGTQYKLLNDIMHNTPKTIGEALKYYNSFVAKFPEGTKYEFNDWVNYLESNFLLQLDSTSQKYGITIAGKIFIEETKKAGVEESHFRY